MKSTFQKVDIPGKIHCFKCIVSEARPAAVHPNGEVFAKVTVSMQASKALLQYINYKDEIISSVWITKQ